MRKQQVTKLIVRIRVRDLAEHRGWSEVQLARLARVDIHTVRRLFRDLYDIERVKMSHLAKFADVFEVSVCTLIEEVVQTKETKRQAN
jgi:transcriptional regulator with XRE-family HTH domain